MQPRKRKLRAAPDWRNKTKCSLVWGRTVRLPLKEETNCQLREMFRGLWSPNLTNPGSRNCYRTFPTEMKVEASAKT